MNPARVVIFMWLLAIAIVTYGHYHNDGVGLPPASGYFGSAVTYSLLAMLTLVPGMGPIAGVFAAGWTFSLYLRVNGDITSPLPKAKAATG